MQNFFSFNTSNKEVLTKLKNKLNQFQQNKEITNIFSSKHNSSEQFKVFCADMLDQIVNLEQELSDLYVILGATIQHNTDLENELKIRNNQISEMWQRYEFIVNASRDWMCLINPDYSFEAVNEAFCEFQNLSKENILKKTLMSFWGDKYFQKKIQPTIDLAFKGESARHQILYTFPNVGEKHLDICYYPFRNTDNLVSHVVFIAKDITEKKQAELLLKEQSDFLNKVKDAVFIHDLDFKITFWNKGAEQMFGWNSAEAIGKNIGSLLFEDNGEQKLQQLSENILKNGEWQGQLKYISKEKQDVITDSQWTLIKDREKKKQTILVVNTDITEKKNLESEFFRSQRSDSLGILASEIAHELNNVLTLFLMSIGSLKPKLVDMQSQTMLSLLESSAKRGGDLVRQILQFSRGIDSDYSDIDIKELLNEFTKMITRTFPKNIEFSYNVPNNINSVYGNLTQLYQVLLNLCINARDAMPDGGKIDISFENIEIKDTISSEFENIAIGNYVQLTVTDTGSGIPKKILNKIFQPFFTTKDLEKGTGLGLSTVAKIIKNHNGAIKIDSQPDKGTTIRILLPSFNK